MTLVIGNFSREEAPKTPKLAEGSCANKHIRRSGEDPPRGQSPEHRESGSRHIVTERQGAGSGQCPRHGIGDRLGRRQCWQGARWPALHFGAPSRLPARGADAQKLTGSSLPVVRGSTPTADPMAAWSSRRRTRRAGSWMRVARARGRREQGRSWPYTVNKHALRCHGGTQLAVGRRAAL